MGSIIPLDSTSLDPPADTSGHSAKWDEAEMDVRDGFTDTIGKTPLIRTDDGGDSVTVCQDKAGADESLGVARDWIQQNASDLRTSPPAVSEGTVILQLS